MKYKFINIFAPIFILITTISFINSSKIKGNVISCKAGSYLTNKKCQLCKAGTYSLKGQNKCYQCKAGTYSSKGSSGCKKCSIGTYSSKGASSCKKCKAGTTSLKGASKCSACSPGTYSKAGSSCKTCPDGAYSLKGASKCTTCPAGTYSIAGAKTCLDCQKDYYSSKGASKCTKCPEGTHTDKTGSSECIKNIKSQTQQDAEALRKALNEINCDEEAIIKITINRTFAQRLEIVKAYKSTYGRDLINDFQWRLFGNFEDAVVALFTDPIEYDVEELIEAMDGFGTDEDTLIEIIASRPPSVLEKIKKKYNEKYKMVGDQYLRRNLENDIEDETSGRLKKLLIALLQCNRGSNTTPNEAYCASVANDLYEAGEDKWGTDEAVFQKYFSILSPHELAVVYKKYQIKTGHSLLEAIDEEFSGDANKMLKTIIYTNLFPSEYFAIRVHDAIKGLGTNDNLLIRVLVTRSEIDMPKIKQYYKLLYGNDMYKDVKDDTSGDYQTLLLGIIG